MGGGYAAMVTPKCTIDAKALLNKAEIYLRYKTLVTVNMAERFCIIA